MTIPSQAVTPNSPSTRSQITRTPSTTAARRLGRGLARVAIAIVTVLVTALLWLPVLALPFTTAVPLLLTLALLLADAALLVAALRHTPRTWLSIGLTGAGFLAVVALAVGLSQVFATTPPILGTDGKPLPNSIATLEKVRLGGSDQWITIRSKNVDNPLLLFLAGGPGGSELASTRRDLSALEDHFIVVNWDQPGAGKSYRGVDLGALTMERYVNDAVALVQLLRERFAEDKVFLVGESWGTILGITLVRDHPQLFYAFVGSGQMVNTTEDDIMGYEFAIRFAEENGNTALADKLRRTGPPPYVHGNIILTYASYLGIINDYMARHAPGEGPSEDLLRDTLRGPEYGLLDKVTWALGLMGVFNAFYPKLADLDFTTQAARLDVPIYFTIGRYDRNAMTSLVEQYYDVLQAPQKELIWFEKSGHVPLFEEPTKFVDVLVNRVLAQSPR